LNPEATATFEAYKAHAYGTRFRMSSPARLLVVDDEPEHRDSLRRIFQRAGYEVLVADDGAAALEILRREAVSVVLTDLVMPRLDGHALLSAARAVQPEADVILMTAYGTVEHAVAAMREGAYDFITKPVRRGEVLAAVERCLERQALVVENRSLKAELAAARGHEGLIGASDAMRELVATLKQVASSSATVLLRGESGTGKELCARALHQLSPRASGPFVAVSCAALPDSILEAELFGAEKGAFTGATERRTGRFERASGGTLLLDEVGDIPLGMQVKLLRVLQEGQVERLGGSEPVHVDVRLVAATHVDLKEKVAAGQFREDLYYRLDVVSVELPPLREREGDVPMLALHFLKRFADKHNKPVVSIEQRALDALSSWPFPGNVRELENAMERALVLCPGDAVRCEDLPAAIREVDGRAEQPEGRDRITFRVGVTMAQLERAAIETTLRYAKGDKPLAARLLGVSLRTLYRRLEERDEGAFVPEDQDP
jgi:two-component system, NtrC family, response regulator HydG